MVDKGMPTLRSYHFWLKRQVPNSTTIYRKTFTQPPDNLVRRLSTASSNRGAKVTTAESENGTSNGRKKSRLSYSESGQ
ncbi:hypothetical protein AZE42_09967 [Rhizopogon vesiculosus]|uniref:Uncharacterized protein n=1 Tax=Rhizopogon vesiculosus TaxID=180088 RepID=A0A1J8PQF9_9AGAM|nr:hypothetical protein AZE42_09967 [Rhizopogon vesiculosus]